MRRIRTHVRRCLCILRQRSLCFKAWAIQFGTTSAFAGAIPRLQPWVTEVHQSSLMASTYTIAYLMLRYRNRQQKKGEHFSPKPPPRIAIPNNTRRRARGRQEPSLYSYLYCQNIRSREHGKTALPERRGRAFGAERIPFGGSASPTGSLSGGRTPAKAEKNELCEPLKLFDISGKVLGKRT